MIYEDFGVWSHDGGLVDLRITRILSRRRRNLQRHQLRAATVFMEKGSENNTDLDDFQYERCIFLYRASLKLFTSISVTTKLILFPNCPC